MGICNGHIYFGTPSIILGDRTELTKRMSKCPRNVRKHFTEKNQKRFIAFKLFWRKNASCLCHCNVDRIIIQMPIKHFWSILSPEVLTFMRFSTTFEWSKSKKVLVFKAFLIHFYRVFPFLKVTAVYFWIKWVIFNIF